MSARDSGRCNKWSPMQPSYGCPSSRVFRHPGVAEYSYDAEPGTVATIREEKKVSMTINALPA